MKLKKRRTLEVPPKIKAFIDSVTAVPLENIDDALKGFTWDLDKGDFHHWVDLFNHFDSFFEKHIKLRKDLRLEDEFLEADPPFLREAVLQILRVIRIILENCTNKHFYSYYEQHLSSLLASTDADVVEAALQTLTAFLKKTIGKCSIRDTSLTSRLFSLAQGWGGKEEGLGLVACSVENGCDSASYELGCTLHFEFYAASDLAKESVNSNSQGLQVIHVPNVNSFQESELELLNKLVIKFNVPPALRFSLLTRLRFAKAFGSSALRQQYICIRLYAFVVLVQASHDAGDLAAFFNNEPEFVNELVSLISLEDAVPEKISTLSILSLVALCQDRSRQPNVLTAVTSGCHREILPSLMQKAIESISSNSSKWSILFAETLLSLVTVLVSSSSGCSALREAGFIPALLPLLKDTNPQHLHLVGTAVHVLEAFMDYSNPAAALYRDLGGLDDTIVRLNVEVSLVENNQKEQQDSALFGKNKQVVSSFDEMDVQPLYSQALISYQRRFLMKALLRAISLGTYAPGSSASVYGSEESLLPHCLCTIFRRAKDFGGGVFSLAATVMSDLIHKDPTCFPILDAAGLPSAFLDAILGGVLCSAEAVTCIPQCLDALCLNNSGLQAVRDRNGLKCFVKIFTSRTYLRALIGDTPGSLSTGLDELMRHASSLRGPGVDMLIEILCTIKQIGSGAEVLSLAETVGSSVGPIPMEMDTEEQTSVSPDDADTLRVDSLEQLAEVPVDGSTTNIEAFLPECISNVARLLETILQNADTCRIFIEKKGIEAILQLFTMQSLPPGSIGHSLSVAFKNFSPQHSAALARSVCTFLREQLKMTNELLVSVGATNLMDPERTKILKCFSGLEGLLSLSNFLLKGTTTMLSELGSPDADILKDLGKVYKEILWKISLSGDQKVVEKQNADKESRTSATVPTNVAGREIHDDRNLQPVVRYLNPGSLRNTSNAHWTERELLSVVHSRGALHRHSRHGLTRIRSSQMGRHLESSRVDSDGVVSASETSSVQDPKKKSPEFLVSEIMNKLASIMRSFLVSIVKGLTAPNRRRTDSSLLSSASKSIATALSKFFHEALSYSGNSGSSAGLEMSLSVKCRYLGKVVDDMIALIFDNRRRACYPSLVNNFYVHGTFKELLTTFEATSQLLWTLPFSVPVSGVDQGKNAERNKLSHNLWLLDTLQSYCRMLEYFVNSVMLLSSGSSSQAQLLVQPVAAGLSIGLFPVPRDPDVFVRMLQSQVLDVILPVWNHPMFPNCSPTFISSIISIVTHIYSGVGDIKHNHTAAIGSINQQLMGPPPDETTIATIVEMGFSRARAEEALRRVETNSVEMAMEWLFSHAEDPVQEDDELARALALSLGNSSETAKEDSVDKTKEMYAEERGLDLPPVEDILTATVNLFHSNDLMAFPLTDLLVTLSNRSKCEDRRKVAAYLIQQLKLCLSDFSKDTAALSTVSHVLALLLNEDSNLQEIAAESGMVSLVLEILSNHKGISESREDVAVSKCISALLLILDSMLQLKPKASKEIVEGNSLESLPDSSVADTALSLGRRDTSVAPDNEKEPVNAFEKILGKSTGYLTLQESDCVLMACCELIKQHVPAIVMQAVLQLCARLTKTHSIAIRFLEKGGLTALFNLPRSCFFPGYDSVASAIVRHLLEDPQTLLTAMELEIRQTLTGVHSRHAPRLSPRTFLTSMAPVIARDPVIFMKAAAAVCQLESSGGRMNIVLLKEKEKEKEKSKLSGAESVVASNEHLHLNENKLHDGPGKCSKGHKKVPASLGQVVDQLLEIIMSFPSPRKHDECANSSTPMDLDEPLMKEKGKSKVDEIKMESDGLLERSTLLAKATFVLKLMSDILVMYAHAAGVILKRDSEMCQYRGSNQVEESAGNGGILHHVLHQLLTMPADKTSATADEWKDKLSEKASWFLVVLCGRSAEGRRRVVAEIVRAFSSFLGSNSSANLLLPNKKVLAYVELVNSILSKNLTSSTLPSPGCSPDVAKTMIDAGIVQSLSSILQVIDLDHPDSPKIVNVILKALECLTRAANASEQVLKLEGHGKKKAGTAAGSTEDRTYASSGGEIADQGQTTSNHQQSPEVVQTGRQIHRPQNEGNEDADAQQNLEQGVGGEREDRNHSPGTHRLEFMGEEVEEGNVLQNTNGVSISFQVEHRTDDDMVDEEDDDIGDGEDDDDEDDEDEEEDEDDVDVAEEGATLISIGGDTDAEDHDDNGLGDAYNDDIMDDEDEDFHENRVIEVRWREGLLQVLGRPGASSGLIDVAAEPFQSLNVDDVFGLRRPLGVERRRQTGSRTFIERSGPEGNTFQHPLLLRPSQTGDSNVSVWSSSGNSLRESEAMSVGGIDMAHFYMFDAPVFPSEHTAATLFGDRLVGSTPPPLIDFSLGSDSMHLSGRRGLGDGRWTDDGQPQAGGQTAFIAQAVEEFFVTHLRGATPVNSVDQRPENLSQEGHQMHTLPPNTSGQPVAVGVDNQQVPIQNHDVQNDVVVHDHNNFSVHGTSAVLHPESAEQNEWPSISQTEGQGHQESDGMNGTAVEVSGRDVGEDLCGRLNVIPESVISSGDLRDVGSLGHNHSSGSYVDHTGLHNAYGDVPSGTESQSSTHAVIHSGLETQDGGDDGHNVSVCQSDDVDMDGTDVTPDNVAPVSNGPTDESSPVEMTGVAEVANQPEQMNVSNEGSTAHTIDPTFLEALPEDLRAEVLASQQAQSVQAATYAPPSAEEIDPEFLAALPPDIQAEVLAQQMAQRVVQAQQASGQPVEMDNASIIATFPADLREEVLLTSSEAVLSALPSPLLAEAQMLRDRAMSHYHARSLFGGGHRLSGRRNSLAFERHAVMDRGVGGTISRRTIPTVANMRSREIEGTPLLDADALKALIRLLRVAQPLGKGLLQRLLLNLCAHTATRATLVHLMLNMITPEVNGFVDGHAPSTSQRLYGCQWNVVYGRPQRQEGLPPLVSRRVLEILTYLATNHVSVANILFYFDTLSSHESSSMTPSELKEKGKEKMVEGNMQASGKKDIPLILFLKLLNQPLFLRSSAHLEQVMNLLQVIVNNVISSIGCLPQSEQARTDVNKSDGDIDLTTKENSPSEENQESSKNMVIEGPSCVQNKIVNLYDIMLQLPESDLCYLCSLLAHEGLSDKVYSLAAEVLKKMASVAAPHRKLFTSQLAGLANRLSGSAMNELTTLRSTHLLGLRAGSMAGAAILRVLQSLSTLTSSDVDGDKSQKKSEEQEEQTILYKLNVALEPLWQELSECIGSTEAKLGQNSTFAPSISDANGNDLVGGGPSSLIPPLPPGTQRLLPFIEAFFVLCEKLQANNSMTQQEYANITAREVKESGGTSSSQLSEKCDRTSQRRVDGNVTFSRFTDRHRRLLNAFIRQNPGLLEKSLSVMLKAPRLIDFDNKKAYFRSRIRQQHEQHLSAPLRISVRRAYVLEDSYNQLRMRPIQDMKGRLTVQFQGEEGIDAGGLTREWYQLLSRVIFDKGALLFTTVGSNSTFQPNPNSVYQTEHLSYFKFVGRLVGKALFDGQLLDVYFTRSFYKHILGVKVTYHDIEAVDPDYYKNLKWMLENDVSEIPDLTFSMDADEEKLILYERTEVTDYELIPGGRNIRVTEDTKHEYVDLVAEHILSNAIRPQINSFLDGFYELVPRDLVSIFNDKELELLISGLPEIDLDDLKENTEYTGYTAASGVVQWFWEVVKSFNKEDMARFLQFVTGTSKVPLEGFKALQGISGSQRFQIHKAYGAPDRLPSAHTCFNQLDLPEYPSKEQLQERLLLAIHEGSEGFGFG